MNRRGKGSVNNEAPAAFHKTKCIIFYCKRRYYLSNNYALAEIYMSVALIYLMCLVLPFHTKGFKSVPVTHCPADPVYDQLEGSASACCDFAGGCVVPSGLDLSRMPEPRHPSRPH